MHSAMTSMEVAAQIAGLLAIGAVGCRPDVAVEARGPIVRDSAGIQVVENSGAGLRAPGDSWSLSARPILEIGPAGDESGTALFRVTDAVRLSDSRIVVANGGTSELLFFSSEGEFLDRAGGAGGGPGEFAVIGPGSVIKLARTTGDTLLAHDWAGGKVMTFAPTGGFVRSVSLREGSGDGRIHLAAGVGWLNDGSLLATTTSFGQDPSDRPGPEGRIVRPNRTLYRFAPDGMVADTIGSFLGDEDYLSLNSNLDNTGSGTLRIGKAPVPFARTFHAATGGNTLAVGVTDRPEILLYGSDGALRRIVRWSGKSRPVGASQREAWIAVQGGGAPVAQFPRTMPAFEDLKLDPEGRLWVEAYEPPGSAASPSRWSVYDPQGRRLDDVAMPEGFQPLQIGSDYMLGVWRDEQGVEYVRGYGIHVGATARASVTRRRRAP